MQENRHIVEPGGGGGSFEPSGDGRFVRGFRLVGQGFGYLREEPRLLVLPALSAVALVTAVVLVFAPVLWLTRDWAFGLSLFAAVTVMSIPAAFASTFLNVAFLSMVQARLRGEQAGIRAGLRFARARWRAIAGWAVMASFVGAILAALQQLPVLGEWIGRLLSFVGGLAWALATFFVVPIMVVEGTGARESLRRSAATIKARWGEAVTGQIAIGAAAGVLILPGAILLGVGGAVYPDDAGTGVALFAAGGALVAAVFAFTGAMTVLFQLLLYRLTTEGRRVGPFSERDLVAAIKPRRRWWGRG